MPIEHAQEVEDLGRIVKMLLREIGRPADDDPVKVVAKYISTDLKRFQTTDLDLFDTRIQIEGMPNFRVLKGGLIKGGGTGIVLQVVNPDVPVKYGLKFLRPSILDDTAARDSLYSESKKEYIRHAPLSHNNVARLFGTPAKSLVDVREGRIETPFQPIMMEWIEDAKPLLVYVLKILGTPARGIISTLIDIMIQCFSALSYVHSHGIIHWDVKSDNLLVNDQGTVKLMDIGNARLLNDATRRNIAVTTEGNYPPALDQYAQPRTAAAESSNRRSIQIPDGVQWDCKWLDMWMLARELMQILKLDDQHIKFSRDSREFVTPEQRKMVLRNLRQSGLRDADFIMTCMRLILLRLLAPENPGQNRYYYDAMDVVEHLRKIEPEFGAAQSIAELSAVPQQVLRIPVSGNVPYSQRVANFFNSKPIRRLSRHFQLGALHQVYPGATHRRSEHVAGVLFATSDYIRALFADRKNPFWRLTIEKSDIEALLFAALVHDIGHIAFGHFLEEMDGLLRGRKHEDYLLAVLDPTRAHRTRPASAMSQMANADRETLLELLKSDWGFTEETDAIQFLRYVGTILRPDAYVNLVSGSTALYSKAECMVTKLHLMHSILDSAIDADKLDYLLRDAHHCGVPYASGIDKDRFFQSLTVIDDLSKLGRHGREVDESSPGKRTPCIGVSQKGILPLESILIARYQMFRSVYWHHTARAQTAMLRFAVTEFVGAGIAGRGDEASRRERVDTIGERINELVERFREQDDKGAIVWLKNRVREVAADKPVLLSRLKRICKCLLGEREFCYKEIFELGYEQGDKVARNSLYDFLLDQAKSINDAHDPINYLNSVSNQRRAISKQLGNRINYQFDDGEILIDIPPGNKDQVDNVLVDCGEHVESMHEVSPMGDAVRSTFRYWTRSVRIFLAPEALKRCEDRGIGRHRLSTECRAVLEGLREKQAAQMSLHM